MSNVKLFKGDCLEVMQSIADKSVDMILCDLPYGTTRNKWDAVIPLDLLWAQYKRVIKDNGAIVLFAQVPFDKVLGASNIQMLKYEWIWEKEAGTGFLNAKRQPLRNHENILVFYKNPPVYNPQMRKGFKAYTCKQGNNKNNTYDIDHMRDEIVTENNGERYPLSIIKFQRDKDKLHPTQKPVALLEYLLRTYTNVGATVLDNCMGSGSTGVACVNTGRDFIGIELSAEYFDIAEQRIKKTQDDKVSSQEDTDVKPTLEECVEEAPDGESAPVKNGETTTETTTTEEQEVDSSDTIIEDWFKVGKK